MAPLAAGPKTARVQRVASTETIQKKETIRDREWLNTQPTLAHGKSGTTDSTGQRFNLNGYRVPKGVTHNSGGDNNKCQSATLQGLRI